MGLRIAVGGGGGGKRRKRGNLRGIKGELDVVVCRAMLKNCREPNSGIGGRMMRLYI